MMFLDSPEGNLIHQKVRPSVIQEDVGRDKRNTEFRILPRVVQITPFTIERTVNEFQTTNYLVKKSRVVKKEKWILGL